MRNVYVRRSVRQRQAQGRGLGVQQGELPGVRMGRGLVMGSRGSPWSPLGGEGVSSVPSRRPG